MANDEIDCDDLFAPFGEAARFRRLKAIYVRKFGNLPAAVVTDGIQEAITKLFIACRQRPSAIRDPRKVEDMLHSTIRNTLINVIRRSETIEFVSLDADYSAQNFVHGHDDAPEAQRGAAEAPGDAKADAKAHARARKAPQRSPSGQSHDADGPENVLIGQIDRDNLLAAILRELDDRYRRIVVQLLDDWTPDEIAEAFGKSRGYRLRDWARIKICRIVGRLAELGNELAGRLYRDGKCPHLLLTVGEADE